MLLMEIGFTGKSLKHRNNFLTAEWVGYIKWYKMISYDWVFYFAGGGDEGRDNTEN